MKILLIFLLFLTQIFAAPAYNKMRDFTQADGTTFKARGMGNQHLNWIETEDGEVLRYNQSSKNFEYATIKNNSLRASGTRYETNSSKRAASRSQIDQVDKKNVYDLWSQKREEAHSRKRVK